MKHASSRFSTRDGSVSPRRFPALVAACLLLLAFQAGCSRDPILVGFAGQLRGKNALLGVQGRNGAMLAVEDVNAGGGVAGRPLKLLVRDDGDQPEAAVKVDEELVRAGVAAIIGHMTSSQTMAALPLAAELRTPLVSPTTSASSLTGQRDWLFRVVPENAVWARALASHARSSLGARRALFVADMSNSVYSTTFLEAFERRFLAEGGEEAIWSRFQDFDKQSWNDVLNDLYLFSPDVVVVSAVARDLAAFTAQLRARNLTTPILVAPWGLTRDILVEGGRFAEGLTTAFGYAEGAPSPRLAAFFTEYRARFGYDPDFAAVFAYEAVQALAIALERTGGAKEGLCEALAPLAGVPGIIGPFSIDEYGDVVRPVFLVGIRDGNFAIIEELPAQDQDRK